MPVVFDFPLRYRAELVPPGKRNPVPYDLVDNVTLSIPEASAEDAPVAMWWSPGRAALQVAVRAWNGDLYQPYWQDRGRDGATPLAVPEGAGAPVRPLAVAGGEEWYADGEPRLAVGSDDFVRSLSDGTLDVRTGKPERKAAEDAPGIADVVFRKVASSQFEGHHAEYQKFMDELLVVEGALYRKSTHPLVTTRDRFSSRDPRMAARRADGYIDSPEFCHSILNYDEALETWRKARKDAGVWREGDDAVGSCPYLSGMMTRPEILRPDLFPAFDETRFVVMASADATLSTLQRSHSGYSRYPRAPYVAAYPRDVLMGYVSLRDARKADAGVDAVLEAFRELAKACGPHGTLREIPERFEVLDKRFGSDASPSPGR